MSLDNGVSSVENGSNPLSAVSLFNLNVILRHQCHITTSVSLRNYQQ